MKELWQSINKFYFFNFSVVTTLALSIILMFVVQFQTEALQDKMAKVENEISASEDEIQLLEVEWVYLTRPERLRTLAANYLKDNGYALASQIKNEEKFEQYHLANYQEEDSQQNIITANNDL